MARSKFSRTTNQRKALFRGLANSLILHETIVTTEPKAKALRPILEKLITKAKAGSIFDRRQVEGALGNPNAVKKMFDLVGPKFKDRPGGYLRITKLGTRAGDAANLAKLEFVEEISAIVKTKEVKELSQEPEIKEVQKVKVEKKVTKKVKVKKNEKEDGK